MASGNAPSLVVVGPKVKAAGMGDIDRNEWNCSVLEHRANLGGYAGIDLRTNDEINFLGDESLSIFKSYTGADLVIQHHQIYVGFAGCAQQTIRHNPGEWKQIALGSVPDPEPSCSSHRSEERRVGKECRS